jgi:hypothetical protein
MRKSRNFAVVLVSALGLAGAAQGAPLSSASIIIPLGTALAPPPITAAGWVGTSFGQGATATIISNVLSGVVAATGITSAPPITQVVMSLTGNAAGNFAAGSGPGGGFGGPMTLAGMAKIKAYSGNVTLVGVPLSPVGQPGAFVSVTGGGGTIIQASGTGWTTGVWTLMAPATTVGGGTATPTTVTATGADLRAPGGAGTMFLVSPLFIRTNLAGDIPTFAVLTLNYTPEPSTLLLFGLGIAGLALHGRKRRWPI